MTLHRQATKVRAMRSVPSIPLHRMAGATRDWSAVSAYVRPTPDPAVGGTIGVAVMVGVVALVGAMLAVML